MAVTVLVGGVLADRVPQRRMGAAAFVVGGPVLRAAGDLGTLLQRRVPPEMLGRVSGLDFFVSLGLMPVSMALAGPLAGRLGPDELAHPLHDEAPVPGVTDGSGV